jgi:hypothetical protein
MNKRSKSVFFSFLVLFTLTAASPGRNTIVWKKMKTVSDIQTALDARIPRRASLQEVYAIMEQENPAYLHILADSCIDFTSPESKARFLIARKWLIRFHFQDKRLSYYTAAEGLTGP